MSSKVIRFFLLSVIFALALSFASGCGDDDDDDNDDNDNDTSDDDDDNDDDDNDNDDNDDDDTPWPDVDDLIEQGKQWLAFPEGDKARLYFLDALEIAPGHPEAMYGLVLSDTVHTTDVFSIVVDYVASFFENGGPVKDRYTGDDLIDGILQNVLNGLGRERGLELIEYAGLTLEAEGAFEHDGIPIFIHYEQVCELATQFDEGELYASMSFAGLMNGLLYHLYALNLDFDLSYGFALVELPYDQMTTTEIVAAVVDILLGMLTDPGYPDFLTTTQEGAEVLQEAGLEVGDGLNAWLMTFQAIMTDTDDQTDDVMGYVDQNGDHIFNPGEPFFIPHFGELDAEQMQWVWALNDMVEGLRDAFYDGTEKDVDPETPNPFDLQLLNPILNLLGLPSLIPNLDLDLASFYADPAGSDLRDFLVTVLRIVDAFLD